MIQRFVAQWVVPSIGRVLSPGAMAVENGYVVAVGSPEEVWRWSRQQPEGPGSEINFGGGVIFPGLINAHTHLDYTCLRGAILPPSSFAGWLDRVGQIKRSLSDAEFLESILSGLREAAQTGTTTLCTIESFPQLLPRISPPRLRVWWFYELSDLRRRRHPDDLIQGSLMFFEHQPGWRGGFGLSPHAPYSASTDLYELTRACASKYAMPWTTHVAESAEELTMFLQARGPLHDFLKRLGRDMSDCGGGYSPLRRAMGASAHPGGAILVHLNYLDERDWEMLALFGKGMRVVHCPTSHRFFGHAPFAYGRLKALGACIALGTDSGATASRLDLREEMRLFWRSHPEVPITEIWKMVTVYPASFLQGSTSSGHLETGARADFVVFRVPMRSGGDTLWEDLLNDPARPMSVWVAGKPVAGVVS